MPIENVGVRAVIERLDQYLAGTEKMDKNLDALIATQERVAKASEKMAAALTASSAATARKTESVTRTKKAEEEHLSVLEKVEKQLKRNISGAIQFSGAFFIIKAQQAVFEALAASIFGLNSQLEQAGIAFTTMLGSARQAGAFLKDLQAFAAATPFGFSELIPATQRMLAYGFAAEQTLPLLKSIGDATSALGSGQEGINRIVTALGQMQQKGRVTGEELRQLAEAGIPGLKILAAELGLTTAEVQALVSAGQVSSDTFIRAFQKFSGLEFGGLMEKQATTFSGALNRIKDELLIAGATAFTPLFNAIKGLAIAIAELVQGEGLDTFAKVVGGVFSNIATAVPILIGIGVAFLRWAASIAIARAQLILGQIALAAFNGQALITVSRLQLLILAIAAVDIITRAFTGRGITERILGIGGASEAASAEVQRLRDRLDDLAEAGVPRQQAQDIVAQDAADRLLVLQQELDKAREKTEAYDSANSALAIGVNKLGKALGFVEDPLGEAQQKFDGVTKAILENTKTANQLRAVYANRPDLEAFFAPEVAKRAASEQQTLLAEQTAAAAQSVITAQRTGAAFIAVSEGIAAQAGSGNIWAKGIQDAVAQTNNKVSLDLTEIESAFEHLPTNLEQAQKIIDKLFVGGKESNAARLFKDKIAPAIEDGVKAVKDAMAELIPSTDETFAEWLARLEKHTENLLNFANNLRYIFRVLAGAGVEGVAEFVQSLENAGPDVTAAVAGMIAIDPAAARDKFGPVAKAMAGTVQGKLTEEIVATEPQLKAAVTDSTVRAMVGGIEAARDPVLQAAAKLSRDTANSIIDGASGIAAFAFGIPNTDGGDPGDIRYSADPNKPPIVVRPPTPSESPGAIDKLAREAERSAREAEEAARKAAREFEEALALAIRTPSQVINEAFDRFWQLSIAGFNDKALPELEKIPERMRPVVQDIVNMTKEARQAQADSLINTGSTGGIVGADIESAVVGKSEKLAKSLNPFNQMIQSGDLQTSISRAQNYMITGLTEAEGPAGDAARDWVDAVTSEIEARMEPQIEKIRDQFSTVFTLQTLGIRNSSFAFIDSLPAKFQVGSMAILSAAQNGKLLNREFDELSRKDLGKVFSSEFLGQTDLLGEATQSLEVFTRAAQDFGGVKEYGLAAVTAYALGLNEGSGAAAEQAQTIIDNVKNIFSTSVAFFDQFGGEIATAIRNQNDEQRDALTSSIDDQITRRTELAKLEEKQINKSSADRLEAINKDKEWAAEGFQAEKDNISKSTKLAKDYYDDREKGIRRTTQAAEDAAEKAANAEIEAIEATVNVSSDFC